MYTMRRLIEKETRHLVMPMGLSWSFKVWTAALRNSGFKHTMSLAGHSVLSVLAPARGLILIMKSWNVGKEVHVPYLPI